MLLLKKKDPRPIQRFGLIAYSNYKWRNITNQLRWEEREAFIKPYAEDDEESDDGNIYLPEDDNRNIFHRIVDATEAEEDYLNRPIFCTRYFMIKCLFWR